MRLRAQPPVHSPIGPAALLAGAAAAAAGGTAARAEVERLLRELYRPAGLLLTNSGTTALQLAMRLAVTEHPGPVALPAYCCYDIATAADGAGVPFVLYDLDPATLGPDWDSLRRALGRGARVVVAVHLYGLPVDVAAMEAVVRASNGVVIEDAAQAVGARLGGRAAGSLGRYAVLSFGRGKGMTGGRGGALLANQPDAAGHLASASGWLEGKAAGARDALTLLAQWLLARPSLYGLPLSMPWLRLGETVYHPAGKPAAPSAFAAGVLTRTLRLALAEAERRRANAEWLLGRTSESGPVRAPRPPAGTMPGFLRLPVVVDDSALPRFRTPLARSLGVWPGYPEPLSDLAGFGPRREDPDEAIPGARALARRLFTLPTHGLLDQAARAQLASLLGAGAGS